MFERTTFYCFCLVLGIYRFQKGNQKKGRLIMQQLILLSKHIFYDNVRFTLDDVPLTHLFPIHLFFIP